MSPPTNRESPLPEALREQMPISETCIYLDHAAVAPITRPAADAVCRWATQSVQRGATVWPEWSKGVEQTRAAAARLIGADPSEVTLVGNTTIGISLVAEGYPWQEGDNAVTLADEFPSNQYPWLNLESRGVQTRRVPTDDGRLDLDRLDAACDERTRIVSISWVGYATGYRHDLATVAEIAHRHGALLFVDAIQGLGAFPLDVSQTPIDFLAADGHKWQLGPEGAGVLYVRREHLDRLRPWGVGWNSVAHSHDFTHIELDFKPSAERFEGGSQNMPGMLGLGASLSLLAQLGVDNLAGQILDVTDLAVRRLEAAGARVVSHREGEHRSGIVAFEFSGASPQAVRQHCLERGVVLSCRGGRLRISPHAYNTAEEIEQAVEVMREAADLQE